ncbi:MAG: bifunctional riboflavin kinase/FAD synthetase [Candidatus Cloacimonadota bacterium]|nr:bifunctional riboflavin kinase/FAD synthetase [Candidatus Cloacimonadota bacterium]
MKKDKPIVITMGTFDGVHIGHQHLLRTLINEANKIGGIPTVLTYYHHPLETLNKIVTPYLLTEKHEKEKILKKYGIQRVEFLKFDKQLSELSPLDFIKEILVKQLNAKIIVVGYDTHFGINRTGNYDLLKKYEIEFGYKIIRVNPHYYKDEIITSSHIRELVKQGKIEEVNQLQGHFFSVCGKVVHGDNLGYKMGFPTVNLQPNDPHKLYPNKGIYVSAIKIGDKVYFGMTNVGVSPTIKTTSEVQIETYIFDFEKDVYDNLLSVIFFKRIRDEIKFDSKEALIEQIEIDIKIGKKLVNEKFMHLVKNNLII